MAVVTLKYIRSKPAITAHLRYIVHRRGLDHQKTTRALFDDTGETSKQAFYQRVLNAGRGTVFYKIMISPDPRREDTYKDLDLPFITRRTIRQLEQALGRRLYFVATVHNDHRPHRHVHGIFILGGRLSRERFRLLQKSARAEATYQSRLERQALDLAMSHPRSPVFKTLRPSPRPASGQRPSPRPFPRPLLPRRSLQRGRASAPQLQPGCRNCGFGQWTGLPAAKVRCPLCRAVLDRSRQAPARLDLNERRPR